MNNLIRIDIENKQNNDGNDDRTGGFENVVNRLTVAVNDDGVVDVSACFREVSSFNKQNFLYFYRKKFANLHHFEDEQKKKALDTYTSWWREYLMWGKAEITEDEFIEFQNAAFKDNKEEFVKRMQKNHDIICDLVDTNRDGFITEEDFVIMYKSGGHADDSVDRRWFNAHNPVDGKIAVKVIVDLWTNFLTCEDSSAPDVLLEQFEAGL